MDGLQFTGKVHSIRRIALQERVGDGYKDTGEVGLQVRLMAMQAGDTLDVKIRPDQLEGGMPGKQKLDQWLETLVGTLLHVQMRKGAVSSGGGVFPDRAALVEWPAWEALVDSRRRVHRVEDGDDGADAVVS